MNRSRSSRRDFLTGRGLVSAVGDLAGRLPPDRSAQHPPPHGSGANVRPLVHYTRRAMACAFTVYVEANGARQTAADTLLALDLLDPLEAQMSVFREESEISQINRRAGWEPVRVERRLLELIAHALEIHHDTQGAYDITARPLARLWASFRQQGQVPTAPQLASARERVGSHRVHVNLNEQSIRFDEAGVELDLGSIGKGYALDRCAELLEARGVRRFLIQGGLSSVLARGGRTNAGTPWQVDLHHPYRPQVRLGCLRLTDRALGTSGSVKQNRLHNGERLGHILDPRSGWPACQLLSATALADRAATADALATAFFVMGVEATQRYCHEHPEIGAVLVCESDNNGPIVTTCGLDRVEWQPV